MWKVWDANTRLNPHVVEQSLIRFQPASCAQTVANLLDSGIVVR